MSSGTQKTPVSNVHCVRELGPLVPGGSSMIFEAYGRNRKKPSQGI